jgi:hypothetical protein
LPTPGIVLILSHTGDPHVGMVTRHLDALGQRWEWLITDQLGERCRVSYTIQDDGNCLVRLVTDSGWEGTGNDIRSVWNRRQVVNPGGSNEGSGDELLDQYVREQRTHLLDNLSFLDHVCWVNHPLGLRAARPKLLQLVLARKFGMVIPMTLCSDDPVEIRRFTAKGNHITKVVSPGTPLVPNREHQYMVFTQPFDPSSVTDSQLAAAPAIYQERVNKAADARVIMVGDQAFGCRIDSQTAEDTALDWRHYQEPHVPHTRIDVPPVVHTGLQALHQHFGLRFSASDFAITNDDRWVYLETNPNGQWGWLEEEAGLPIGQALAKELADHNAHR